MATTCSSRLTSAAPTVICPPPLASSHGDSPANIEPDRVDETQSANAARRDGALYFHCPPHVLHRVKGFAVCPLACVWHLVGRRGPSLAEQVGQGAVPHGQVHASRCMRLAGLFHPLRSCVVDDVDPESTVSSWASPAYVVGGEVASDVHAHDLAHLARQPTHLPTKLQRRRHLPRVATQAAAVSGPQPG